MPDGPNPSLAAAVSLRGSGTVADSRCLQNHGDRIMGLGSSHRDQSWAWRASSYGGLAVLVRQSQAEHLCGHSHDSGKGFPGERRNPPDDPGMIHARDAQHVHDRLLAVSAAELLKQVNALPQRERRKFVLSFLKLEASPPVRHAQRKRRVKWPDVEARAKHIFGHRVLPNLVLLERSESAS